MILALIEIFTTGSLKTPDALMLQVIVF